MELDNIEIESPTGTFTPWGRGQTNGFIKDAQAAILHLITLVSHLFKW